MDKIKSCRKTLGRTYVRAAATCKQCPMHETCCKEIDEVERKQKEEKELPDA